MPRVLPEHSNPGYTRGADVTIRKGPMLGTAIDTAKSVAKLAQTYQNRELYQQAVELMGQVTELAADNFTLKKRITELEEQLERKGKLIFHENFYWYGTKSANVTQTSDGPFCS